MPYRKRRSPSWFFWVMLGLIWLLCSANAWADSISDRLAQFPHWVAKPSVAAAQGDLYYPDWLAGEWQVTTTLVDLVAPLAPALVSPGFESNRQFLNQPVPFAVRFAPAAEVFPDRHSSSRPAWLLRSPAESTPPIVADRAFNGLNLAKAYLGEGVVTAVTVDPQNPNRQITQLRGDRQLTSTVTGRQVVTPNATEFLTTEVFQQVFRGQPNPYLNEVETTTHYQRGTTGSAAIVADQVTAIYLSPQDADYFRALNRPVALYRYRLEFQPKTSPGVGVTG